MGTEREESGELMGTGKTGGGAEWARRRASEAVAADDQRALTYPWRCIVIESYVLRSVVWVV